MCVCDFFSIIIFFLSIIIICNSVYILHLTAVCSCTFGKGWVCRAFCIFWYECPSVVFSLRELTCMHCVFGAGSTQGFVWKFLCAIYIHVHSFSIYIMGQLKSSQLSRKQPVPNRRWSGAYHARAHWLKRTRKVPSLGFASDIDGFVSNIDCGKIS